MRFLLLIYFGITALYSMAGIDSLKQVLNKHIEAENTDEIALTYFRLGVEYNKNLKYQEAITHFNKGLRQCKSDTLLADFHLQKAYVYKDSTNYKKSLFNLHIADSLYKELNNLSDLAEVYNVMGVCYGLTNNLNKATEMFRLNLALVQKLNIKSDMALAYYNIGLAHYFQGDYKNAIDNNIKSLKIRETQNDTSAWVSSLTTLGEIFRIRGDLDNALKYYKQALTIKEGVNSRSILAYIYSEIALVSKLQDNYTQALLYIDTAMTYSIESGYKRGVATLQSYKADIYKIQGKKTEAFKLYKTVLLAYHEIGFEPGIVQVNLDMADFYIDENQPTKAIELLNYIKPLAQNNNLLEEQVKIENIYYQAFKTANNFNKALKHHESYVLLKDSLFNAEKEKQIKQIETEFEVEHKEQQISLLDKENKIQQQQLNRRNILLFSAFVLLLLIILLSVLLIRQNKLKSQLQIEQNQQKLLRSQMNPHFIYNALGAIQNFIFQHNPMDSATYISEFSALMRLVLEGSRNEFVKLSDDIKLVTAFLKLQQLRFNHSFSYEIQVDSSLNTEFVKLPPMLSQPAIENAVEHGMRSLKEGEGNIIVKYQIENNKLRICISDNGKGFEKVMANKKHKSLATQITKERISNIKKTHGLKINMEVQSRETGTNVIFKIDTKL